MIESDRSFIYEESLLIANNKSLEDLSGEMWKPIIGYEDLYAVSNLGRVKSLDRYTQVSNDPRSKPHFRHHKERILTQTFNDDGYLVVGLTNNNKGVQRLVHRLVYQMYVDPSLQLGDRENTVNHRNTVKVDNRVENLELLSRADNTADFYSNPDFADIRKSRIEKLRKASTGVHQSRETIQKRIESCKATWDRKRNSSNHESV